MKESFFIDMYAAKNGVMNPRDGTQKDTSWNTLIPTLNTIWSYGFQCACKWQFEIYMFGIFKFLYLQALAQLDKHKASCDILMKVPPRIKILIHLIILDLKTALPMPWNNPTTPQTENNPIYIYIYICMLLRTNGCLLDWSVLWSHKWKML